MWRRIDIIDVPRVQIVRSKKFHDDDGGIGPQQDEQGGDRDPVSLEPPPDHLPLRGEVILLLLRRQLVDGMNVEGCRGGKRCRRAADK